MTSIVLAPGHYESYRGVAKNGYNEYDEVVKIVEHLTESLTELGHEVQVVEGKLIDKVNRINEINPALAVEVHLGNTNNNKTSGSRAFFMLNNPESKRLATSLLNSCVDELGTKNKGAYIGWFKKITPSMVEKGKAPNEWKAKIDLFLSKTVCPSAIIEPFYISSTTDCEDFISAEKHKE